MRKLGILSIVTICWVGAAFGFSADDKKAKNGVDEPQNTHGNLTRIALERSNLANAGFLKELGLPEIQIKSDSEKKFDEDEQTINFFPNSQGNDMTIYQLVPFGVSFEDTIDFNPFLPSTPSTPEIGHIRVFNHFYDPQQGGQALEKGGITYGRPSLQWAIDDKDITFEPSPLHPSNVRSRYAQKFSYANARDYYYGALTNTDAAERKRHFGLTFQTLGHVVHHFQDMAQPQHVRNDTHTPWEDDFFEAYVKKLYGSQRLEDLLKGSAYENIRSIQLPRAIDYGDWEGNTADDGTDRIGMAEYTSTNFISADINFIGDKDNPQSRSSNPLPIATSTDPIEQDIQQAALDCGLPLFTFDGNHQITGTVKWVTTQVNDRYLPPVADVDLPKNLKASTYSLWSAEIEAARADGRVIKAGSGFTVNECIFDKRLEFVIPRAVAFSTGLIDYFFRGTMQISLPEEGVYAIKDYSTPHSVGLDGKTVLDSDPSTVFGFEKIRLNLRNTTPAIDLPDYAPFDVAPYNEPIPQELFDGTVQAVVKYSLNHCYQQDGSGGFGIDPLQTSNNVLLNENLAGLSTRSATVCKGSEYFTGIEGVTNDELVLELRRRTHEKIATSLIKTVGPDATDNIVQIPSDQPLLLEFDFSDNPIPVNATDVRLQVIYRGKLGPKVEDPTLTSPSLVEQDAVVVATHDISEPSDVVVSNLFEFGVNAPSYAWFSIKPDASQDGQLPENYTVTLDPEFLTPGTYVRYINGGNLPGTPHATNLKVELTVPSRFEWRDTGTGTLLHDHVLSNQEIELTLSPQDADHQLVGLALNGDNISNSGSPYTLTLNSSSLREGNNTLETVVYHQDKNYRFKTNFVVHNNQNNNAPQLAVLNDVTQEFIGSGPNAGMAAIDVPLGIMDTENTIQPQQIVLSPVTASKFAEIQGDATNGYTLHFYSLSEVFSNGGNVSEGLGINRDITVTVTDDELETSQTFTYNRTSNGIVPTYFQPPVLEIESSILTTRAVVHTLDPSIANAPALVGSVRDYRLGTGEADFDSNIGEGVKSMVDINLQMSDERAAANAQYTNLVTDSLLKKAIDIGIMAMPTNDYDPLLPNYSNQLRGYLHDTVNDQNYALIYGLDTSSEKLAKFEMITSIDYGRVGYLSDYGESFSLYAYTRIGGPIGKVVECIGIRPEKRQWNEDFQRYEYSGAAIQLGDVYSNARSSQEAICEMGIYTIGNINLIANNKLTATFESSGVSAKTLTINPAVSIHSLY